MALILILVPSLILLDIITKFIASSFFKGEVIVIINNVLSFTYIENTGASFGIFKDGNVLLLIVAIITVVVITYILVKLHHQFNKVLTLSLILLLAGSFGNMFDRILYHAVIDWIDLVLLKYIIPGWNFVFNFADMFIIFGVVLLFIDAFFIKDNKMTDNEEENETV